MQNHFTSMTKTALPNIVKLTRFFNKHSQPVLFTQHGHPPADFEEPITNQLVRKWGISGSIHTGSEDWELMPQIQELVKVEEKRVAEEEGERAKDGVIVPKNTYDAFLHTGLEERLRGMGVERVVICGVMTDCCCDTSGRSAFNRGFETWLVSDAMGSVVKRQHEAGLKGWGFGFGDVIATEEVIERLSEGSCGKGFGAS
ncbi:Isochorismatase hydrolase [Lojkania enalia]|uniref:Isochorismatase hydrolase n=1 Tax=Lojkania enalia TaxID=147567 RepID=A0A9P4TPJ7_9PLEO|nr:Isochorismatase hydrolase [Didymosphaeria enalia]